MIREIIYSPRADFDVDSHFAKISSDHLDAAVRFLDAVDDAVRKLARMPGMGAPRDFDLPTKNLRSWPIKGFRNFLIFYRFSDERIEIIRIVHGAQDITAELSED